MTRDDIQAFLSRFVATWERGDVRALSGCYAENATLDSPLFQKITGRERIEKSYVDLFRVFAKWKVTVDETVIDTSAGERAVVIVTAKATHVGEVLGYAGSGRQFTIRSTLSFTFEGGLIMSETRLYDFTGLLVQLGVLKAKGG